MSWVLYLASAISEMMPNASAMQLAATGALKIVCIGFWMSHLEKIKTASAKTIRLKTLPYSDIRRLTLAGLRECYIQHYDKTPKPVWNPDLAQETSYFDDWSAVPEQEKYNNAFKAERELFLRHVVLDEPFPWNLMKGAKGVQLAEKSTESLQLKCWIDVPALEI